MAFLTAKAQADQLKIEDLEKKLHSSQVGLARHIYSFVTGWQLHKEDLEHRIRTLESITNALKKDLKLVMSLGKLTWNEFVV